MICLMSEMGSCLTGRFLAVHTACEKATRWRHCNGDRGWRRLKESALAMVRLSLMSVSAEYVVMAVVAL